MFMLSSDAATPCLKTKRQPVMMRIYSHYANQGDNGNTEIKGGGRNERPNQ